MDKNVSFDSAPAFWSRGAVNEEEGGRGEGCVVVGGWGEGIIHSGKSLKVHECIMVHTCALFVCASASTL